MATIVLDPVTDYVYDPVTEIWATIGVPTSRNELARVPVEQGNAVQMYVTWLTQYTYYQVEWRKKYRFRPSVPDGTTYTENGVVLGVYDANEQECWTEYPEEFVHRQRADDVADTTLSLEGKWGYIENPFSITYKYKTQGYLFDMEVWQFRIRPFAKRTESWTEGDDTYQQLHYRVAEWSYREIPIVYVPCIVNGSGTSVTSAGYDATTADMELSIASTWERPFTIKASRAEGYIQRNGAWVNTGNLWMGPFELQFNGMFSQATLPFKAKETDTTLSLCDYNQSTESNMRCIISTSDGVYQRFVYPSTNKTYSDFTIVPYDPSTVIEPVWDVTQTDTAFDVVIKDSAQNPNPDVFSRVDITAKWTDIDGSAHGVVRDAEKGEEGWGIRLSQLPYDVDVTLSAYLYFTGAGWMRSTYGTIRLSSHGRFTWSYGDEVVSLQFDGEPSYTYTPEGETVKTAGRKLPVSRYGAGGTRSITLSGYALNPMFGRGGIWRPELKKLEQPHDWTLRMVGGAIYRVRVDSVDCEEEVKSVDWKIAVDVSMTEVDGGLV